MFRREADYRRFLVLLRDGCRRYETLVHGYVLMTNHFHLLVTPNTPMALERMMQLVASRYTNHFNRQYGRTGTLYEGRYKSSPIDNERYWLLCLRYIELNPVRAGMVSQPGDYPWSSFHANAHGTEDDVLTPHVRYVDFGVDAQARQEVWKRICTSSLSPEELDRIRFELYEQRIRQPLAATASP